MIRIIRQQSEEVQFDNVEDYRAYLQVIEDYKNGRLYRKSVVGQIKNNLKEFLIKIDPLKPQRVR